MKTPIRKNAILIAMITIILILTGCAMPDETNIPTARLLIPVASAKPRTILPDVMADPAKYDIVLTSTVPGQEPIPFNNKEASAEGYIDLVGVPFGTYDVSVVAYDSSNLKIYEGKGKTQLVVDNIMRTVEVDLHSLTTPGTTGKIAVLFDWSSLVIPEEKGSRSIGVSLSKKGPISQAIADGYLKFVLYIGDTPETMKEHTQSVEWNGSKDAPGSKLCVFSDVPVSLGAYTAFSVLDKQGHTLVDKQFSSAAQVYTGQTSYYKGNSGFKIYLKENRDTWYRNISNVRSSYPFTNTDSTLNIEWNDVKPNGKSIFKQIEFVYGRLDGQGVPTTKIINTASTPETSFTMEGLEPGVEYYVTSQTTSQNNTLSDIKKWTVTKEKGFTTKVEVESIEFTKGDEARELTTGDTFEIEAVVHGVPLKDGREVEASYNELTWEATKPGTLFIPDLTSTAASKSITAQKPGITRITVRNSDPNPEAPNTSLTTTNDIKIKLDAVTNVRSSLVATDTAQTGIKIEWDPVLYAESYQIYRSEDSGNFIPLFAEEENEVMAPEVSFIDTTVLTGKSYSYYVVAKAATINQEYVSEGFVVDSKPSNKTEAITMPTPQLLLKPVKLQDKSFELIDQEGHNLELIDGMPSITLMADDIKTVTVGKVENAVEYKWILNNVTYTTSSNYDEIKNFTLSNKLKHLNYGSIKGLQTLQISVKTSDGRIYSETINVSLITLPVSRIQFTEETTALESRISMDGLNLQLSAYVTGGTEQDPLEPTNTAVQFKLANPTSPDKPYVSEIASIDPNQGIITVHKPGTVEFIAYAEENPRDFHISKTITFYQPTIKSDKELVNTVNAALTEHLIEADKKFGGDWFPPKRVIEGQTRHTYNNTDKSIVIKSAIGGGTYTNEWSEPTEITFNNYKLPDGSTVSGTLRGISNKNDYRDASSLSVIGIIDTKKNYRNTLDVTLPNTQGKVSIKYIAVSVVEQNVGTYEINFEHPIKLADGTVINDFNYSDAAMKGIINPKTKQN